MKTKKITKEPLKDNDKFTTTEECEEKTLSEMEIEYIGELIQTTIICFTLILIVYLIAKIWY